MIKKMRISKYAVLYGSLVLLINAVFSATKPNIVIIVADDLGWNDISFHGSDQIPTPNIDKLAKEGVILNNYYVQPICTPSRSAIMTGRYPIHTGMQEDVIHGVFREGVGLNETFLPQMLKEQGYSTHAVGKWHLGFYAKEYTPTYRGFDTFYGYYNGRADYWDHSCRQYVYWGADNQTADYWGLDLQNNEQPVYNQWGNYSTEMFTAEAEDRIYNHNQENPLFLYLAYQAVHRANLPQDGIQAPQEWIDRYKNIEHEERRKFAAMVGYMDYGVGRVYDALEKSGMLDNTVIIFTSDNGGPANGFNYNWANNFPLRGVKSTLWEGGIRASGCIYSKLIEKPGRTSMDLIHITDWVPTLVNLAGGKVESPIDGFDQWATISESQPSPREEILLNIDPLVARNKALRHGDWKILQETGRYDGWYPPPEVSDNDIHFKAVVDCGEKPENVTATCTKPNLCLFNIASDPCEYYDLSEKHPDVFEFMKGRLQLYEEGMVPARKNRTIDPLSNPKLHNGVWVPWVTLP